VAGSRRKHLQRLDYARMSDRMAGSSQVCQRPLPDCPAHDRAAIRSLVSIATWCLTLVRFGRLVRVVGTFSRSREQLCDPSSERAVEAAFLNSLTAREPRALRGRRRLPTFASGR
jgi:hypothetical protein